MIHFIRALFILLVAAVALTYTLRTLPETVQGDRPRASTTQTAIVATATTAASPGHPAIAPFSPPNVMMAWYIMVGSVIFAFAIIIADLTIRRKNLQAISGLLFGLLVGMVVSLGLGYLIDQLVNVFVAHDVAVDNRSLIEGTKLLVALMVTYLTVSFILQTKDDFRFIIPYVEFARATKGPRPLILDTSVIIDGRIADLATCGVFDARMLIPRFVLNELQAIADSSDRLKRTRARRGLDVLARLQGMPKLELHIWDGTLTNVPESEGVDQKLVALAQQENARIVTNDFNLNKVATLRGVEVININSIADAIKPVVLPGEQMHVRLVKPGDAAGQGVGYLSDGTMVVVEQGRDKIGQEVEIVVTNAIQTAAGKMIFGRVDNHATLEVAGITPGNGGPRGGRGRA